MHGLEGRFVYALQLLVLTAEGLGHGICYESASTSRPGSLTSGMR